MIVPMKKVTVITQGKDADSTVGALRKLGVLHVEYEQPPQGKDIDSLKEEIALVTLSLEVLSIKEFLAQAIVKPSGKLTDWIFTARHIIDLHKRLQQLDEYGMTLTNSINQLEPWGDFDPAQVLHLAGKNIFVRLYQIPIKEMPLIPSRAAVKIIFSAGGIANCAVISQGEAKIPFKEVSLPKAGLNQLRKRLAENNEAMRVLKQEISKLTGYRGDFMGIKNSLEKELEFRQALRGMGQSGPLAYIAGYVPFDKVNSVTQLAEKEKWGLAVSEPAQEDNPPVLLRNPKWVSLLNPVYKLMEVVPGYRELDISPVFLLFLALFFGMIIGDAGYGAVYFALTFLAQRKYSGKVKDKTVFSLFYLFSSCAIIWGLLTGTVFGQQWYLAKGFKALAPVLNNTKVLMAFCFLLGALQLSLAHAWGALTKLPALTALADIGFICLLWVGFFLAKMFILGDAFPLVGNWLLWIGVTLIILFINPRKSFLKTIGAGLGTLALGLMGNFGDIVSYIRLFAVGLAGVAVADSVNLLAAGAAGNIIAQIIILFIGHSINIILGPLSVLVHGIRLNVLEFSVLHGNITWSGTAYTPLKE